MTTDWNLDKSGPTIKSASNPRWVIQKNIMIVLSATESLTGIGETYFPNPEPAEVQPPE